MFFKFHLKNKCFLLISIILNNIVNKSNAFPNFMDGIPNGQIVPNPCHLTQIWAGVGHINPKGAGPINPFGLDFKAQNFAWTLALCRKDSDGDGRTNGLELGDPNCVWNKENNLPQFTQNISHPGICDPFDSVQCKDTNRWLQCNTRFYCPGIKSPDVINQTLRFPLTNIPAKETNIMCKVFLFPQDTLYDIIAEEPIIDNPTIIHHMVLVGCLDGANVRNTNDVFDCESGAPDNCSNVIAVWAKGATGGCNGPEYGFRIGRNPLTNQRGFKYALLQIHWTNYALDTNLNDSSGLLIYYTPILRPNQAAILMLSQNYLFLPPRLNFISVNATCESSCTQKYLNSSVNIAKAGVHMHMLGRTGSIKQYRNGSFLRYILLDRNNVYNAPALSNIFPYEDFMPGDQLVTICNYNTSGEILIKRSSQGSNGEMCLGFLVYYPAQKPDFIVCGQYNDMAECQDDENMLCDNTNLFQLSTAVNLACVDGKCSSKCYEAIGAFSKTGCLENAAYELLPHIAPDIRLIFDLIDNCQIRNDSNCNYNSAQVLGSQILEICDFRCESRCVQLINDLKKTGCIEIEWRFLRRKYEMIAAFVMSCEQFIQVQRANIST